VVEHFLDMHKALGLVLSTTNKIIIIIMIVIIIIIIISPEVIGKRLLSQATLPGNPDIGMYMNLGSQQEHTL
jgi:hypothetical protein